MGETIEITATMRHIRRATLDLHARETLTDSIWTQIPGTAARLVPAYHVQNIQAGNSHTATNAGIAAYCGLVAGTVKAVHRLLKSLGFLKVYYRRVSKLVNLPNVYILAGAALSFT